MLEKLTDALTKIYRQDLQDYKELLKLMEEFSSLLEQELGPDELEAKLNVFAEARERIFNRLQESASEAISIQKQIASQISKEAFDLEALKTAITSQKYEQLVVTVASVRQVMGEVLKCDDKILPRLTMELESIKLELHRIQGAKKTKNAYDNHTQNEARFIDKTK